MDEETVTTKNQGKGCVIEVLGKNRKKNLLAVSLDDKSGDAAIGLRKTRENEKKKVLRKQQKN